MHTNEHLNREPRWDIHHEVPSGWARQKAEPGRISQVSHQLYDLVRRSDDGSRGGHEPRGRRVEPTQRKEPADERELPGGEDA